MVHITEWLTRNSVVAENWTALCICPICWPPKNTPSP